MEKKKYNVPYAEIVNDFEADAIVMSAPGTIGFDKEDDYIYDW